MGMMGTKKVKIFFKISGNSGCLGDLGFTATAVIYRKHSMVPKEFLPPSIGSLQGVLR
jgi:hypothetical protein